MTNHEKILNKTNWIKQFKNYIGLPRPYIKIPDSFIPNPTEGFIVKNNLYLHKTISIPWQSIPILNNKGLVFNVLKQNESKVFKNNLCGYCGIRINIDEYVVRWITLDEKPAPNGPRVMSDYHPMHIECMKQARHYCPYMRQKLEKEFEYGLFNILKNNLIRDLKKFD